MNTRTKEWIKRYIPAEIVSLIVTIATIFILYAKTHSRIATALAGTWLGSLAYFGYILISDIIFAHRQVYQHGGHYTFTTFLKNIRALLAEFGLAELVDSLLIRPALMYYLPILTGSMMGGSMLAKFAADITFYIPAIISYELSKSRFRKFH
jgi:hypothetical protein